MIGVCENTDGELKGFRIIDTNTMKISDIAYEDIYKKMRKNNNSDILVENLVLEVFDSNINGGNFPYIDGYMINECWGQLSNYPKVVGKKENVENVMSSKNIVLIGMGDKYNYICVDVWGTIYSLSREDIMHENEFGLDVVNKYYIKDVKRLGDIDIEVHEEFRDKLKKYNNKCRLLGIIPPLIKNVNGKITLVAGNKNENSVVIPPFITHIGDYAFNGCDRIKNINIPFSVIHIGRGAFSDCRSLDTISIPKSVRYLGLGAFRNSGVRAVFIEGRIKELSSNIFSGCKKLGLVVIPDSITTINDGAFYGCGALSTIKIADNDCNCNCNKKVTLPSKLERIGLSAFCYCERLEEIEMPDTVISAGIYAFADCKKLRNIKLSRNLRKIEPNAFRDTAIEKIEIHKNTEVIDINAFNGCKELKEVIIHNKDININNTAFRGCSDGLKFSIAGKLWINNSWDSMKEIYGLED